MNSPMYCDGKLSQREGIDYTENFAAVIRYISIRYLVALAVTHGMYVHQMDAVNAYLNTVLQETVYMQQPELFDDRYLIKNFIDTHNRFCFISKNFCSALIEKSFMFH